MPKVLTETAQIACAHMGKVQAVAGQVKLKVQGSRALVSGDLAGKPVAGCATPPNPNTSTVPCLSTTSAGAQGVSTKLKVNGRGVLLESISGQTSGTVGGTPQTWSVVSANQLKLNAG